MLEQLPGLQGLYTSILGIILSVVIFSVARWVLSTLRPSHFPPGPPVIPGLGNLHQIPLQKPYLKFHSWAKQYGDLVSLKTGARDIIVINSAEIVHELFDKRGAIYSNRPYMYVLKNHVFYTPEDKPFSILQYDEYYRRWRKTFQYLISNAGIKRVTPLLEAEASRLSQILLEGKTPYIDALRAWALAVPIVAVTGNRLADFPQGFGDRFFQTQKDFLRLMVPGAAPPVDIFPILRYVPERFAAWKTEARRVRKVLLEDAWRLFSAAEAHLVQIEETEPGSSTHFEGLITKLLRERRSASSGSSTSKGGGGGGSFSDLELAYISQDAVGASIETTSSTFKSLMCFFASFPDILRKAQEEVDRVAGDKAPTGDQISELVYLRACVNEVLRFRPPTPSALPHTLAKDDQFGPYFSPKGTTFIPNAWTINRNEKDYNKPEEFIPERFITHPYGLRVTNSSSNAVEEMEKNGRRSLYCFGSGRRQCPGEGFAIIMVLLAASKAIWTFDVLPPKDGVDISIETGYMDGAITEPANPMVLFRLRDASRNTGLMEDVVRTQAIAREMLG